jgi:rhomboid protease GluP
MGARPMPPVSPALVAFRRALAELTPRGFVTEALIAINVLVFVVMVARGVSPMSPTVADMLAWGADYAPRTAAGQGWRLVTAMFLHVGAIHLGMNMYVLWNVGRLTERIFGNVGFAALYLAAGLAGSVASIFWSPFVVSAGASGAIFGVYGGLGAFLVRQRASVPREALTALSRGAILFVGYNLLFGLGLNKGGGDVQVDMAAHVGGLAGGFLAGLALAHPLDAAGASTRGRRAAATAIVAAALSFAAVRASPARFDVFAEIDRFQEVEKRVLGVFQQTIDQAKAGTMNDAQLADAVETGVLPEWRAAHERFAAAKGLPAGQAKLVQQIADYMAAREEGWSLLAQGARTHDKAVIKQASAKQHEADDLAHAIGK